MHALEWGLVIGVIAMLVGPFLTVKTISKLRERRQRSNSAQARDNAQR